MSKDCIILHIPHSSLIIPEEALHQYDTSFLQEEFKLMTDRYTDELFSLPYTSIVFPYSRLFCDVERFRDDNKEEMSQKGMGVIYTRTHNNIEYRKVSPEEKSEILTKYYDLHHQKFEKMVEEKLKEYDEAFIIDCHSFNPYPLPHENDKTERPDICIGIDDFHTDKRLIQYLKSHFESKNYTVKINSPFQGTIVPLKYYGNNKKVGSIMIELNRNLYMNNLGEKIETFNKLKKDISEVISGLCNKKFLEQPEDPPQMWEKHWEDLLKEVNMKKMYVEPDAYFTPSMKKILEEGNKKALKKTDKTAVSKKDQKSKK